MRTIHLIKLTTLLTSSILIFGCNQSASKYLSTYNKSSYNISSVTNKSAGDSVDVHFTFDFADEKTTTNPVQILAGCDKYQTTDKSLNFKLAKMDMPIQFKISSIGYFSIETTPVVTNKIGSISIHINVSEDDRPLLHCEKAAFNQMETNANC